MVVRGDEVQACDQVHCQHSSEGPPVVRQSWRGRGFYNLGPDWLPLVAVGCTDQSEAPTNVCAIRFAWRFIEHLIKTPCKTYLSAHLIGPLLKM